MCVCACTKRRARRSTCLRAPHLQAEARAERAPHLQRQLERSGHLISRRKLERSEHLIRSGARAERAPHARKQRCSTGHRPSAISFIADAVKRRSSGGLVGVDADADADACDDWLTPLFLLTLPALASPPVLAAVVGVAGGSPRGAHMLVGVDAADWGVGWWEELLYVCDRGNSSICFLC